MRRRVAGLARSGDGIERRRVRGGCDPYRRRGVEPRGCSPAHGRHHRARAARWGRRELCRRLREWSAMPVILLSATRDEHNQVRAFEAGADDYMTKPLRPRELVARLLAKLRRAEPGGDQRCLELCGLEIDLAARAVRRDADEIHLTPIEFKLLGVLLGNRGRVLTHSELLQQVWGAAYMDARETLRGHMANLRRKIEPADGGRLIHTDHGVGYRLADTPPRRPAAWPPSRRPRRSPAARAAPPPLAALPPSRRPRPPSPVARSLINMKSGDLTPISGVRSPRFVSGSPETRAAATGGRTPITPRRPHPGVSGCRSRRWRAS